MNPQTTAFPITTRGIGFNCCLFYNYLSNFQDIRMPDIYTMYRVGLACVECQLTNSEKTSRTNFCSSELFRYRKKLDSYMLLHQLNAFSGHLYLPEHITKIVNQIGNFELEQQAYAVFISEDKKYGIQNIPQTENIILSNLRKVVTALADSATPADYRKQFRKNSPLPAAKWSENDILTNPNDFMPEDYNIDNDICDEVLNVSLRCQAHRAILPDVLFKPIIFKQSGRPSQLLSNYQGDLRAAEFTQETLSEYYEQCIPKGNIDEFWSTDELSDDDAWYGMVSLLGEMVNYKEFVHPIYSVRTDELGRNFYSDFDYKAAANRFLSKLYDESY